MKFPENICNGSVALSPMDDVSDSPFRIICRELGSSFSFTEFVSADAIIRDVQRSLEKFSFREPERPIIMQIFGSEPDVILEAARKIEILKPDGIDINMGCSVKKIFQKGAGVGLMQTPEKVKEIFRLLRKNITIPVSAKIRLGKDESQKNYLEIGKILEGEGAWGIFVHGRTKAMAYSGRASWDDIGNLKQSLSIPVFGNGDIASLSEAMSKIKEFNLNGVLIGRAAIGNPWIFSGKDRSEIQWEEKKSLIQRHLDMNISRYGQMGVILFRKQLVKYIKGVAGSVSIKPDLVKALTKDQVIGILNRI